ncbi:Mov34/MPN/PAD-1 family protein [Limnobacter sp.]|uniref:Mov34/MPN/PAD-1 family protein n=1 Tax=Limnobacter sp. TaxID=2003368 RepID=UPI003BADB71C
MPFVTEWSTTDRRNLVVFAPNVLKVFKRYRQRFNWQLEGGGILLGRRRGEHLEVLFATEPSDKDRRSVNSFVREADGHAEIAHKAWQCSEKQIDYLGEWHTHPQQVPTPSTVDRHEWGKLIHERPVLTTILVVVVGTTAIYAELINGIQNKTLLPLSNTNCQN